MVLRDGGLDTYTADEATPSTSGSSTSDTSASDSAEARRRNVWAIVLAGGEGRRLRPLVRRLCGEERPKQYVKLLGARSLLRQTLDRTGLAIPARRTLVVTMSRHAGYIAEEFAGPDRPALMVQPCDRGTAAAILYATHWVGWQDPTATVAVFPSDHFVPAAARFMAHVAEVAGWVERHPERVVLLGAPPTTPETQYGWIEPGDPLGEISTGAVRRVRHFWEKPTIEKARISLASGHLWNTSVIVGKVAAIAEAGRRATPIISDRLARLERFAGTSEEEAAAHQAYLLMPKANFSRTVLEGHPEPLAVSQLPRLLWSDLGSPRRVVDTLRRLGIGPTSIHAALAPGTSRKEVTACL